MSRTVGVCARREDSAVHRRCPRDAPHCRRAHGWCSSRKTCSGRTPPTVTRERCAYSARTWGNPNLRECSRCLPPVPHADERRQLEPRLCANDFVRGVDSCATRIERSSSDAARRTCSKSGPSMHGRAQRRRARRRRAHQWRSTIFPACDSSFTTCAFCRSRTSSCTCGAPGHVLVR